MKKNKPTEMCVVACAKVIGFTNSHPQTQVFCVCVFFLNRIQCISLLVSKQEICYNGINMGYSGYKNLFTPIKMPGYVI